MPIKDIVNRELVNLINCEQEPIHIPGSVQPHGFLLALKGDSLTIDFCSANIAAFTGLHHEQVLGRHIEEVIGGEQANALIRYIASGDHSPAAPLDIEITGNVFACSHHTSGTLQVLELEPRSDNQIAIGDFYRQTRLFTHYMQQAGTLKQLCQSVADETRAITGYDRVMVYRFDEQYNGEVYAESRIESVEPFLGLFYPHTDIPAQARELYIRNLLRIIVDVNYTPVPIYTIDDAENKNIDLGRSTLRSVSPIHIQYLKNIGVTATLTISLLHENRLWGLIACHHYSPRYISSDVRIAARLQGHFLTSQIHIREVAEEYEVAKKVSGSLDDLLTHAFTIETFTVEKLIKQPQLTGLANAASVIIEVDGHLHTHGHVPPPDDIRKLLNWLHMHKAGGSFSTDKLSTLYPDAKNWSDAISGIVFHSLGNGLNNAIIWGRPHSLEEVTWAGDPNKAIIMDENGLSPRKSFGIWKEVKNHESRAWLKPELFAASNLASALQKHLYTLFLSREELKQRKLSEKLQEANAELENINWISSHDLQEPLRKIQLFASKIIDDEDRGSQELVTQMIRKINESAKRMQLLVKDMLSYSNLRNTVEGFTETDLNQTLSKVLQGMSDEISAKKGKVESNDLPVVNGVPVLLQQLLMNLLRNALKFAKAGTDPLITITYKGETGDPTQLSTHETFYAVTIQDNGIGFDNKYNESIFKVFTRLNNKSEYTGSGVGLALCRKIMKSHNGYIAAQGIHGEGASFTLFFPVQ